MLMLFSVYVFFFFKQKTAYEMRISDWSSDVCSSDLAITTTFYIPAAAIGDMYEIEASQIAVDRAKSAEVKAFARQMIMDHSKTSQKLEDFVTNNPVKIAIPENMDGRRSAMIENLRKASDEELDTVYMGKKAAAHDEAIHLHKS